MNMGSDGNREKVISLNLLFRLLLGNWKKIALFSFGLAIVGVMGSFLWPKEYESKIYLLPENQSSVDIGSLSGLAGLAGFDLGNLEGSKGISVKVYSKIVSSQELNLKILNSYLINKNGEDSIKVKQYLEEGVKGTPVSFMLSVVERFRALFRASKESVVSTGQGSTYLELTNDEYSLIDELKGRISISYNPIDGVFHISSKMQDKFYSAQILDMVITQLEARLVKHKTNKEYENAQFIKGQMDEAELELKDKMRTLANFIDRNKNRSDQSLILKEEFLKSEYRLAFEIHSTMAKQYAQSLIKVEESKPEFVYLDSIQVPVKRSSPKRVMAGMVCFVLGIFISGVLLIWRHYRELIIKSPD